MYISKNQNDKGRVKSYTINDVSWNDLKRLLVSSDALKEASIRQLTALENYQLETIELKLSKQGE